MEGYSERLNLGILVVSRLFFFFFFLTLFSHQIWSSSHGLVGLELLVGQFHRPEDIGLCLDMVLVSQLGEHEESVLLASRGGGQGRSQHPAVLGRPHSKYGRPWWPQC